MSVGGTISQYTCTLDSVGNRIQLQETLATVGGGSTIAGLPSGATNSCTYDPVGNRLTSTTSPAMTYDRADRIATLLYTTDPNGNLTRTRQGSYQYDRANRVTSGQTDTHAFDSDGKRTSGPRGRREGRSRGSTGRD